MATTEEKKVPNRRSRSVSAMPRTGGLSIPPPENMKPSASDEFSIKRDNPLFCSSSISSSSGSETAASGRRGRPVSSLGRKPERMRSVSREPCGRFESDVENGHRTASSLRNKENSNVQSNSSGIADEYGLKEHAKNLRTWTSQHPISKSWDASTVCAQARVWEDGISSSSFSETEETTVKARDHSEDETGADAIYEAVRSEIRRAVSEIQNDLENAIHRRNPSITSLENIVDISSELVNPASAELVTGIRTEYATKLEQSRERARKLRADLAVEEQREQELSRIIEEIHHAQKCSDTRKCRPRRRVSMERLRMSRHLEEEAMHYFDECVSISTFDSAEFSSLEDPHFGSVPSIPPTGSSRSYPNEVPLSNFHNGQINQQEELDNQTRCSLSSVGDDFVSSSSSRKAAHPMNAHDNHDDIGDYDIPRTGIQFSFAREATEDVGGSNEIRHYVKKFESEISKERTECTNVRSTYDPEDYDDDSSVKSESLLFDRLILGNRIESGGLLFCSIRIF